MQCDLGQFTCLVSLIGPHCPMRSLIIAMLLACTPLTAMAQETTEAPPCFDAVAVGTVVRQTPGPIPDVGPDAIVIRWPWELEFQVEQIVYGPPDEARLRVWESMHAGFNPRIAYFLLFLRRDPVDGYFAEYIVTDVIRDVRGRFIIPFERPVEDEAFESGYWLPENYETYLRPISYRNEDAWLLASPYLDEEELAQTPPGWHTRHLDHVVALRGLYVDDLRAMLAAMPGALCASD